MPEEEIISEEIKVEEIITPTEVIVEETPIDIKDELPTDEEATKVPVLKLYTSTYRGEGINVVIFFAYSMDEAIEKMRSKDQRVFEMEAKYPEFEISEYPISADFKILVLK